MCCASDNHNYMCHTCAKEFLIRASIKQLLTKYQISTIIPQISNFHKNRNFSSLFGTFLDQLLHPYKFHGGPNPLYAYHMDKQPLPSVKTPVKCSHDQTCYRSNTFKSATDGILEQNSVCRKNTFSVVLRLQLYVILHREYTTQ